MKWAALLKIGHTFLRHTVVVPCVDKEDTKIVYLMSIILTQLIKFIGDIRKTIFVCYDGESIE